MKPSSTPFRRRPGMIAAPTQEMATGRFVHWKPPDSSMNICNSLLTSVPLISHGNRDGTRILRARRV
jgi:hypothetical protein